MDLTFSARTPHYALRRGTMKAGHEIDLGPEPHGAVGLVLGIGQRSTARRIAIDNWWGQRDHSWGIRNHARCPFWMWLAIQLPDGMLAVWNWELANGARVLHRRLLVARPTAATPVPVVGFRHDLDWIDDAGAPV